MTDPGRPAPRRGPWRCRRCGTQNPALPPHARCRGCGDERPAHADPEPVRPEESPRTSTKPVRLWLRRGVAGASYAYAALVLAGLALIRWVGDGWWGVMILLFMPRWLLLGPVLVLGLSGAWARSPALWAVHGATALVVAGPLMGFSVPLPQFWELRSAGDHFRIMTYNRGEGATDARQLIALIERERVDLICFPEAGPEDPDLSAYFSRNWYRDRQRFLASRHPIVHEYAPLPLVRDKSEGFPDLQTLGYPAFLTRVRLRAPSGAEFLLASVHLPTLKPYFDRLLNRDIPGMERQLGWWRHELDRVVARLLEERGEAVLAAGEFNMPPDDSTMAALRSRFLNAFEQAGWGYGYTRPGRTPWLRTEHILASPHWQVRRCWVGPDLRSDHRPLLAEVVLPSGARADRGLSR